MHRFGHCFQSLLRHQMYFATHETFHRYVCRWRHKIRKIAVEILQSVNNRTQSLRDIAYYAWLLLTYIVINTLLGRLTLHPAGTHCPSWDDAFVSSFFCVGHAPSLEHGDVAGCIVRTSIALPFIGRFRRGLQRFFHKGFLFQTRYIVVTFFAKWRHNFREIGVKNRRKRLCAPLRIDS